MPAGVNFCYFVAPKEGDNYFANAKHFCEVESYVHGGILSEEEMMDGHKIYDVTHVEHSKEPLKDLDGNFYTTEYIEIKNLDFDSLLPNTTLFINTAMFEADIYYDLEEIKEKLEELKETHKIAAFFHFIY